MKSIAYADCSQPAGLTASDIVWGVCYRIDAEKEDEVRAYLGMCWTDHMTYAPDSAAHKLRSQNSGKR
jgi:cation transport regulator ChaC